MIDKFTIKGADRAYCVRAAKDMYDFISVPRRRDEIAKNAEKFLTREPGRVSFRDFFDVTLYGAYKTYVDAGRDKARAFHNNVNKMLTADEDSTMALLMDTALREFRNKEDEMFYGERYLNYFSMAESFYEGIRLNVLDWSISERALFNIQRVLIDKLRSKDAMALLNLATEMPDNEDDFYTSGNPRSQNAFIYIKKLLKEFDDAEAYFIRTLHALATANDTPDVLAFQRDARKYMKDPVWYYIAFRPTWINKIDNVVVYDNYVIQNADKVTMSVAKELISKLDSCGGTKEEFANCLYSVFKDCENSESLLNLGEANSCVKLVLGHPYDMYHMMKDSMLSKDMLSCERITDAMHVDRSVQVLNF